MHATTLTSIDVQSNRFALAVFRFSWSGGRCWIGGRSKNVNECDAFENYDSEQKVIASIWLTVLGFRLVNFHRFGAEGAMVTWRFEHKILQCQRFLVGFVCGKISHTNWDEIYDQILFASICNQVPAGHTLRWANSRCRWDRWALHCMMLNRWWRWRNARQMETKIWIHCGVQCHDWLTQLFKCLKRKTHCNKHKQSKRCGSIESSSKTSCGHSEMAQACAFPFWQGCWNMKWIQNRKSQQFPSLILCACTMMENTTKWKYTTQKTANYASARLKWTKNENENSNVCLLSNPNRKLTVATRTYLLLQSLNFFSYYFAFKCKSLLPNSTKWVGFQSILNVEIKQNERKRSVAHSTTTTTTTRTIIKPGRVENKTGDTEKQISVHHLCDDGGNNKINGNSNTKKNGRKNHRCKHYIHHEH